ncbi:MAG: hypothetical protein AAF907_07890, partial [Planctomycetota bacterium]
MSLSGLLEDVFCAVRFRWNNRFRRRLAVLKCEAVGGLPERPDGVTVVRYGPNDELPADLTDALAERFGSDFPAVQRAEAAEGATLWLGLMTGDAGAAEPAGFARTRPGDRVEGWHEPLGPNDRLVYAMATARRCRGRGVS